MGLVIDLSGRRALVTGVTQGIGAGIARQLAAAGADVAGCGLEPADHPHARAFRAAVESAGRRAWYAGIDVVAPGAVETFVAGAVAALGGADLLVANAGRNVFRGAAGCSDEEWRQCLELDLASHWRLARAAKPHLEAAGQAAIIVISSNHARATLPGCFPYNVAKAGLEALVQSLALEWGPRIRTVGIAPGFVDTAGTDAWFRAFPDPVAKRAAITAGHPVGRIGIPDDIGSLCAFLASRHAGFISGTTLLVDGGHGASLGW